MMDIVKATKKALREDKYIRRKAFRKFINGLKIKPTNTSKCCVVFSDTKPSANRWNPTAEDLVADDWLVVD